MKYFVIIIEVLLLLVLALISFIPVFFFSIILNHLIKSNESDSDIQSGPSSLN